MPDEPTTFGEITSLLNTVRYVEIRLAWRVRICCYLTHVVTESICH